MSAAGAIAAAYVDTPIGPQPFQYRSSAATYRATATTANIALPAGFVAGDLLAMAVIVSGGFNAGSPASVATPTGWTLQCFGERLTGWGTRLYVFTKTAASSDVSAGTVAVTRTGQTDTNAVVLAYSGTTGIDVVSTPQAGAGGAAVAPSVNTTGANRLVLSFFASHFGNSNQVQWRPEAALTTRITMDKTASSTGGACSVGEEARPAAGATSARSASNAAGTSPSWVGVQLAIY